MPKDAEDARPAQAGVNNQNSGDGGFTQVFAALGGGEPAPRPDPAADDFAKLFLSQQVASPASPGSDATLIFEAIPTPASRDLHAPSDRAAEARGSVPAVDVPHGIPDGEFTQIFRPLTPPTASLAFSEAQPSVSRAAAPASPVTNVSPSSSSTQPAGEFTQIFSAVSLREQSARKADVQHSALQARSAALPESARNVTPSSAHNAEGSFTQLFPAAKSEPEQDRTPALRATPSSIDTPPVVPSHPAPEASFTQVFQQIQPPPSPSGSLNSGGRIAPSALPPISPQPLASQPFAVPTEEKGWPAFGPPAKAPGSFTDVFAAQSAPVAPVLPVRPEPSGSDFTELFRSPAPQTAQPDPFMGLNHPAPSHAAQTPNPWGMNVAQEQSAAAGQSEFTRLMHSLQPGATATPPMHPAAFGDPFQAATPNALAGGESEYTRVLRGSARRDSSPPIAPLAMAPAAGSPGVALASAPVGEKRTSAPAKSKMLVIVLVVVNALLLVALIVIGIIFLHRK